MDFLSASRLKALQVQSRRKLDKICLELLGPQAG
jgi:hypothetical protein